MYRGNTQLNTQISSWMDAPMEQLMKDIHSFCVDAQREQLNIQNKVLG